MDGGEVSAHFFSSVSSYLTFPVFHYLLFLRPRYLSFLGDFHMINESGVSSGGEIE